MNPWKRKPATKGVLALDLYQQKSKSHYHCFIITSKSFIFNLKLSFALFFIWLWTTKNALSNCLNWQNLRYWLILLGSLLFLYCFYLKSKANIQSIFFSFSCICFIILLGEGKGIFPVEGGIRNFFELTSLFFSPEWHHSKITKYIDPPITVVTWTTN